ncbi:MAG TPA: peptidoglycan recognition family protein, partial [Elusimicrobiales bacterium]|nr:peptidoglycan recognition family protein [Elusimicrobiales bacterium]
TQIGPSIDRGWGIMHLVDNDYCQTLSEASSLLGLDPQVLKDDPRQNIRGAAVLLAAYAREASAVPGPVRVPAAPSGALAAELWDLRPEGAPVPAVPEPAPAGERDAMPSLEDWFPAVSRFSGLRTRELRDLQARNYFRIITSGVEEKNVFNQTVKIEPSGVDLGAIGALPAGALQARSQDYPPALSNISPNNFTYGRGGQRVDTIVEHWMGVGTYAGAISWFHDPRANASAHFCIRHDDGEVTQVVRVNDTAWYSGCQSCPWTNNARSIGVEHEATVTHPEWWNSEPMLDASAALSAFFAQKYAIPLSHPQGMGAVGGIIGHNQVPGCDPGSGCHTDCPGNLPWDVLMKKISDIGTDEL